jgi:hypothetical protein
MLGNLIFSLLQLVLIAVLVGLFLIVLTVIISVVYLIVKNVWHTATEEKVNDDDQA